MPTTNANLPIEVSRQEYDRHLGVLIGQASGFEADRLRFAQRKGWVVPRGADLIFVRGR